MEHDDTTRAQAVQTEESQDSTTTALPPTKHEPHAHAKKRILAGVIALVLALITFLVWVQYGEGIKEWCTGEEGTCTVDLGDIPPDGVQFEAVDF
jgi:hypothetical protein